MKNGKITLLFIILFTYHCQLSTVNKLLLMVDARWGAQVINKARHYDAQNPKEKIEVDEPRFKCNLNRNHIGFQNGKNDYEDKSRKHIRNQFCHTLKIIQSNTIDVNSLKKDGAI